MGAPVVSPAVQRIRVVAGAVVLAALLALTGCGGAAFPDPTPSTSGSTAASPSGGRSPIPADGYGLRAFGIRNGPAGFSVPRGTVATTVVDQANNVVLVLAAPAPAVVSSYLRRVLPQTGFTITADDPGLDTLSFAGEGWTGSFTSTDRTAAILLRPI